ncbi:hypothetical protein KRMM14A1259_29870 [Krasilnikovia sp. MM14-A1259]
MTIETIPLFPEPERPGVRAAKTLAQLERDQRPAWTSYSGRRVACDECVTYLHENHGDGPLPRSARRVRTVRATGGGPAALQGARRAPGGRGQGRRRAAEAR